MAVSRKTQKDVGKYQAKLVGPFTVRQTVFVGVASILAIIIWNLTATIQIESTERIFMIIMFAAPIAILGFLNPYGMTAVEFIKQYYEYHILSSKQRPYVTVTDDERIIAEIEKQERANNPNKKPPQNKSKNKKNESNHKKLKEFPEYQ